MTSDTQPTTAASWDPVHGRWVEPGLWDDIEPRIAAPRDPRAEPATPVNPMRVAVAGGIVGAFIATLIFLLVGRGLLVNEPVVERRLAEGIPAARDGSASVIDIAARARPWVVNVIVTDVRQNILGDLVPLQGTGTGIIIRSDGHIITNAHVAGDADEVDVVLASGDTLSAEVVGSDPDTDVAVLKVDGESLPAAVIGSAKNLRAGETAVAIGSPLGLEQSVTSGIVSALGRTVDRPGQPPLVDMIQTDAAVTQGNSGGALVDGEGAVIGITTAIAASPDVGAEGIAFAIPIDVAIAVADELIEFGRATHPWLGVTGGNITPEVAEQFGVEQGARIISVEDGSPASAAGIRADDIVVSFDGERIDSMDELVVAIREHAVGDTVPLEVVRDGDRVTLQVTIGDRPE